MFNQSVLTWCLWEEPSTSPCSLPVCCTPCSYPCPRGTGTEATPVHTPPSLLPSLRWQHKQLAGTLGLQEAFPGDCGMLCQSQAHHAPGQPTIMQSKMDQHCDPCTFFLTNKQTVIFEVTCTFKSLVKLTLVYNLKESKNKNWNFQRDWEGEGQTRKSSMGGVYYFLEHHNYYGACK